MDVGRREKRQDRWRWVLPELVHGKAFPKISSDSNQNKENLVIWMVLVLLPKSVLLR